MPTAWSVTLQQGAEAERRAMPRTGRFALKNAMAWRALAVLLSTVVPLQARAEATVLKFGFPGPVSAYLNVKGMTPWLEAVNKASDGTLEIKLFAGPTLGTFRDIYDRTLNGVAQISFGIFGPLASQFPRTQVTGLPFLTHASDTETSSVALWRLFARGLIAPEYGKIKVLALFNFPSSVLNTNKPINTIDDMKGLKVAVSSRTAGEVTEALGASPVTLTPTELYQSMSRGVVDGIFVAWTAVGTWKLAEVTKDHLEVPVGEAPAFVFMNKASYDALPAMAKRAIDKYSGEAFSHKLGALNKEADRGTAKATAAMSGQEIHSLSPAQYAIWEKRAQPVIDRWVGHTPDGAKLLAAYREELKKLNAQ
jgi:TRAP-type C4-dicarboxylate transport system substrate-binding protein